MTIEISPVGQLEAERAYVRYCSGIAMLQRPQEWAPDPENINENIEPMLVSAEQLLLGGSRRFIHAAAEVAGFESLHKASEYFDEVAPVMYELLDSVSESQIIDLNDLNPIFSRIKPAAFLDRGRYNNLTRGKYQRISVISMLDDMVPADIFAAALKSRRCHGDRSTSEDPEA